MKTRTNLSANDAANAWIRALQKTAAATAQPYSGFALPVDTLAANFALSDALVAENEVLSFDDVRLRTWRYAHWALTRDLGPGSVVALVLHNQPDYLPIWLGIARTGATVALINTNLAGAPLAHAINLANPSHIIVGADLIGPLQGVLPLLSGAPRCWSYGPTSADMARIDPIGADWCSEPFGDRDRPPPALSDRALLIYTSGTTGLPKAASISHHRAVQWINWFAGMMNTGPADRMYHCLPMYHSIGGVVATGAVLSAGGAVIVRPRFSASRFWSDIVQTDCTLFQYIGELCRYLLNSPPDPAETAHRLRLCCGNGLRAEPWEAFQKRFGIPRILEFYAATEATFSLYNCEGKPGAIGRIPRFLAHRVQVALIRVDEDGEAVRDANGFCIRCPEGETGEAINRIDATARSGAAGFEGYTDDAASRRKILRDVFAPGDAWYRSGDLMRIDGDGFFYFVDRTGDTFRWKGENVSTTEVAEVIAGYPGITEAVVYGVSVPGTEGRAGMAAIRATAGIDMAALRDYLDDRLPPYARPVFIRLAPGIEMTGTFRPRKQTLAADGFDPSRTPDPLFFAEPNRPGYLPIGGDVFRRIGDGDFRL